MTTISICNALNMNDERWEEREAKYMQLVGKYKKDLVNLFPKMLADLVELMENGKEADDTDPLGEFFQNHITHGEHGQFFTPMPICRMMAQMTIGTVEPKATVLDPACGSGRTLISALEVSRDIIVYGCDLDRRCFLMATLNLFLRGAR